jgi:hypothetical protein
MLIRIVVVCRGAASFESSVHAHPHSCTRGDTPLGKPLALTYMRCQSVPCPPFCRRRSFACAANDLLSSVLLPPQTPRKSCSPPARFLKQAPPVSAQHWNPLRISFPTLPGNPEGNATHRVQCNTRQIHASKPTTGLIDTNKRATVQGSSTSLRPRPRPCFLTLHFTLPPPHRAPLETLVSSS